MGSSVQPSKAKTPDVTALPFTSVTAAKENKVQENIQTRSARVEIVRN